MSERSAFFEALTEELPHDVWGARLKEELEAHLEDAQYFAALEGETPTESDFIAALGSPTLILKEFRHAMTYKSPHAFSVHALAAGLLATPLVYLAMIATHTVLLALPIIAALFSYYLFALAPMLRHIDGRAIRNKILAFASGIPALIVGIPMIVTTFTAQVSEGDRWPLVISFLLGIVLTFICARTAAWQIEWEQRHPIKKNGTLGTLRTNAVHIMSGVCLVFAILVVAMSQNAPSDMSVAAKLHFVLSAGLAAPNAFAAFLSPITAGWISGIVLSSAGLIALGFVLRTMIDRAQKRETAWPWGWMIVALVTVPLVAFPPHARDIQNISWSDIPHTRISETIERSELGPFYRFTKYVNQMTMNSFSYFIAQEDGRPLQIKQLPDHVFTLSNLNNVNDFTITASREPINGAAMLTNDVWCRWKNPTSFPFSPTDDLGNLTYKDGEKVFLENSSPIFCSDLWVGEKEIFTVTEGIIDISAENVTRNTDGTWMLFKHDTDTQHQGTSSPDEVYLIDLR